MAGRRDNTERIGVNAVENIFLSFGWTFRPQTVSDYGIDAQVEIWEKGEFTGKLIALQIKSGKSYFNRRRGADFVFRDTIKHLNYWLQQPIPVFLILHNPIDQTTLWQKIEQRLAAEIDDEYFEILVPERNSLNEKSKFNLSEGLPLDEEAIRRFNLAFDLPSMRSFKDKLVFFQINDWVNKTLNIRGVDVYFDDYNKSAFDMHIHLWTPAPSFARFMEVNFPWLDFTHVETDEALTGEVEIHTLEVCLNKLAVSYLAVEDYIADGPPEFVEEAIETIEMGEGFDPNDPDLWDDDH